MSTPPRLDRTLALLADGYRFAPLRHRRYRTDVFETRLLGQPVIVVHGPEAARVFYDGERFQRTGAMPKRVQEALVGTGGVQMLDDGTHEARKAKFMALMTPERVQELGKLTADRLKAQIPKWEAADKVVVFDQAREVMCRVAFEWAGIPISEQEVSRRANDLGAMVDAFGRAGPVHWRGRWARRRGQRWVRGIVRGIRKGRTEIDPTRAAAVFALGRDPQGKLLDESIAATDLISVVRPITAIDRYITFLAMALHAHPAERSRLEMGEDEGAVERFVQEVRRFYPYTPFAGARVRLDFEWRGHRFPRGRLVLLDVYGASHDPELWENPEVFSPQRFERWEEDAFDFIPQGGGEYAGHRCAGEWVTIAAMKAAAVFLTRMIDYDIRDQDLTIDLRKIPTRPASGFVITNVRRR